MLPTKLINKKHCFQWQQQEGPPVAGTGEDECKVSDLMLRLEVETQMEPQPEADQLLEVDRLLEADAMLWLEHNLGRDDQIMRPEPLPVGRDNQMFQLEHNLGQDDQTMRPEPLLAGRDVRVLGHRAAPLAALCRANPLGERGQRIPTARLLMWVKPLKKER